MAMEKVWKQINERLEAIETKLQKLTVAVERPPSLNDVLDRVVTKEEIMNIKGVGESTADQIMELLTKN